MQNQNTYGLPVALSASNKQLLIDTNENILLDGICTMGFFNLGLTVVSSSGSAGNVNTVKTYGSEDQVNYYSINSSALTAIAAGATAHVNFTSVVKYIRVTAIAASTATVDCYLSGTP